MDKDINIVIVGHVDHGKSSVIGRLLVETDTLPLGKLEQIKERCRRNSKQFEYAFLLDALKDEQSQGITIDAARCFFKTKLRRYMILDAPGHIEFLKNMITGAAKAQAALLVIDANEGIQENTKRHAYMLSLLGINQVIVLVNKLDLIAFDESKYTDIVSEFKLFLNKINMSVKHFIPISAINGDNISAKSTNIPWYNGKTLLQYMDLFENETPPTELPFRMYVQDVYKFTLYNDNRRIIVGTIETGVLNVGDRVVFYPSGKTSTVKTIEDFNKEEKRTACAGEAIGFALEEQLFNKRGELATVYGQLTPVTATTFKANIFWLGKTPLCKDKKYTMRMGTNEVEVVLSQILGIINSSNLDTIERENILCNEVAECIFIANKAIAVDNGLLKNLCRFVLVENYDICGGGIISEALLDDKSQLRKNIIHREYKWEKSNIGYEERKDRYKQEPKLILITGPKKHNKKAIGKALEEYLFEKGRFVYYIGMGSILHGLEADISFDRETYAKEYIRRLSELANIMLDAGLILIVSASDLNDSDAEMIKMVVNGEVVVVSVVGEVSGVGESGIKADLRVLNTLGKDEVVRGIVNKCIVGSFEE